MKAENVTGVGGGPCTGPSSRQHRNRRRKPPAEGKDDAAENVEENAAEGVHKSRSRGRGKGGPRNRGANKEPKDASSFWHYNMSEEVKEAIASKNIRATTGTIDLSFGETRIKLGTGGYASMAHANGILAEGSFSCETDGQAKISLEKVLSFADGEWKPIPVEGCGLPTFFSLCDGKCNDTFISSFKKIF